MYFIYFLIFLFSFLCFVSMLQNMGYIEMLTQADKTEVTNMLASYAKKADLSEVDLSLYALKTDLPKPLDLSPYAKTADLPKPLDLSPYAKTANLSEVDLTLYAKKTDLSSYALNSELLNVKTDLSNNYVKTTTLTPINNDVTALKNSPLLNNTFQSQINTLINTNNDTILPAITSYNSQKLNINQLPIISEFVNKYNPLRSELDGVIDFYIENVKPPTTA